MRHLYLAATGQNRGKTTTALGFLDGFIREGLATGFMKPVGQRTVIQDGVAADEDAVLMKAVFDLPGSLNLQGLTEILNNLAALQVGSNGILKDPKS